MEFLLKLFTGSFIFQCPKSIFTQMVFNCYTRSRSSRLADSSEIHVNTCRFFTQWKIIQEIPNFLERLVVPLPAGRRVTRQWVRVSWCGFVFVVIHDHHDRHRHHHHHHHHHLTQCYSFVLSKLLNKSHSNSMESGVLYKMFYCYLYLGWWAVKLPVRYCNTWFVQVDSLKSITQIFWNLGWLELRCNLLGMVNTWPLQSLSELQLDHKNGSFESPGSWLFIAMVDFWIVRILSDGLGNTTHEMGIRWNVYEQINLLTNWQSNFVMAYFPTHYADIIDIVCTNMFFFLRLRYNYVYI